MNLETLVKLSPLIVVGAIGAYAEYSVLKISKTIKKIQKDTEKLTRYFTSLYKYNPSN